MGLFTALSYVLPLYLYQIGMQVEIICHRVVFFVMDNVAHVVFCIRSLRLHQIYLTFGPNLLLFLPELLC